MKSLHTSVLAAALSAAVLVSPAMTERARACGGFWCSNLNPVDQSAEQIIFVDNSPTADTITAIIQIQYVGPSEKFAWLIPIPGDPTITVSSNMAFQRLDQATAPQYILEREIEGMCMPGGFYRGGEFGNGVPGAAAAPTAEDASSGVTIVNMGSVGPYDYTTIAVDRTLDNPADVAIDWFMAEGYDLSGVDDEVLGPYLADGLNLLAFKLTKGADVQTGAIRPVSITYDSKLPMIPIRPTAVAAQNDMGIRVWVAAHTQAIPSNYKSLVINEALINWFYYQSNYDDVVTEAANQAGGQGFVTELAAGMADYKESIYSPLDEQQWMTLMNQTFPSGIDAIFNANNYYRGWDGWVEAIQAATTLPDGTAFADFLRNPDAYRGTAQVDTNTFFRELYERVVKPVSDTQELIASRGYLTRMYSTMSAEEMTVDPAFNYNSDLAAVSNIHTAKQFIECSPTVYEYDAPWRIELPQGGVIRGKGSANWPIELDALPANLKVVQLSTTGSGAVVEDNSGEIGVMLYDRSHMMASPSARPEPPMTGVMIGGDQQVSLHDPPPTGPSSTGASSGHGSSGSCAVAHVGAERGSFALLLLGLAAVLGLRRRRL